LRYCLGEGVTIKRLRREVSRLWKEGGEVGGLGEVLVVVMKIISWNVRGFGSFEKRREVKQLVREKNPFILCIQETKLAIIDDFVCKA